MATFDLYGSVNNKAKEVKELYGSVNGKTKGITKLYGSVNGKARLIHKHTWGYFVPLTSLSFTLDEIRVRDTNLPYDFSTELVREPSYSTEKITWSLAAYSDTEDYTEYYTISQEGLFDTAEGAIEPPHPVYVVATSESGLTAKIKFIGAWVL